MSDLLFKCPDCGKSLAVDQSAIGAHCVCSDCRKEIDVPQPAIQFRCAFCSCDLLVPDKMGGELVECPGCETGIPMPRLVRVVFD